ncbi:MAG TPA: M23 family metallopeptidase [Thermomicrobiales bacterium]|nr:M23 family metallopeptidase [Thermomicrobiales bacterium]
MRRDAGTDAIEAVTIHPVFRHACASVEHAEGELRSRGDALGRDCWVVRFVGGWYRPYEGDGTRNEDWYCWRAAVLAPFDGVVESTHVNPVTNQPGHHPGGRASSITFRRADGVRVLYAHVDQIAVRPGETVVAGQPVARVGNNGTSRHPHLHVGAWRDDRPLQIRFDLRALGRLQAADPEGYAGGRSPGGGETGS